MKLENTAYKGFTVGLTISLSILALGFILAHINLNSSLTSPIFYAGILILVITPVTVIAGLLLIFIKNGEKYMAAITLLVIVIIIFSGLLKKG